MHPLRHGRIEVDDGLGQVDREEVIVREAHQAAERIAPQKDRSCGQELLIATSWRVNGILQLINGLTALCMSYDCRIAIDLDDIGGNKRIVAHFKVRVLVALLPRIPAAVGLLGRAVPDDFFFGEVGHVLVCQATSVRTGHMEQLSVEADLLEYQMTKGDLE